MVLEGSYDLRLVALSIVIAAVASYIALSFAGRAADTAGPARRAWLAGGVLTMAIGVWLTHLVGTLAFRLPLPAAYEVTPTLLSAVPAVVGSAIALSVVSGMRAGIGRYAVGGLFLGAGIASTHYLGITALRLPASVTPDSGLVALSVAIAVVAATAGLSIALRPHSDTRSQTGADTVGGALLLGIAMAGMHYSAMAAVSFEGMGLSPPTGAVLDAEALTIIIVGGAFWVLAAALVMAVADQRLALRSRAQAGELEGANRELEKKVHERNRRLREAVDLLKRDISARERVEAALAAQKDRAETTLHSITDAVITTDRNGVVEYMNPVAERLVGWSATEARGQKLTEVYQLGDDPRSDGTSKSPDLKARQRQESNRFILLRRDGRRVVVDESSAPLRDHDGNAVGTVTVLHDATQAQRMADELRYHTSHDPLTGLINRGEFERRLDAALQGAREERVDHALAYIDLDQFKVVNDVCGHMAGDALLRSLAALLRERVRENDTLARLGGDEFGVLLDGCPLKKAEEIAELLRQTIDDFTFNWHKQTFSVGASIGLVAVTFESDTVARLLSAADVACYAAKDQGRNRVQVYHPSDEEIARRHGELHWVARVNKALQEDRFCLFAQTVRPLHAQFEPPKYREILIRIVDKDGTLIPPGAFIPPAERYDLMPKVDRWVISSLFASLAEHLPARRSNGGNPDSLGLIAVNVSAASINDETFIQFLHEQFRRHSVPPNNICFELTESTMMGTLDNSRQFVNDMHALGCHLALDDFGSGMSSFVYLKNLPVDYLKIDGSLIRNLTRDAVDQTIIEAINRTAHALGMRTIAETVEESSTLDILRHIGVDYAQGMAVAPPRPLFQPEAIEARDSHGGMVPEDLETTLVGIPRPNDSTTH